MVFERMAFLAFTIFITELLLFLYEWNLTDSTLGMYKEVLLDLYPLLLGTLVFDKKMIKNNVLVFILIGITIISCLPESLFIEVEPAESQLIVSSVNIDTLGFSVFITRSFSALEGNEDSLSQDFINKIVVSNAKVTLTIGTNTMKLESLEEVPGIYFIDELPIEDSQLLRLDVFDSTTGHSVYAETQVVPPVSLNTAGFLEEILDDDTTQCLFFSFKDQVDADNWYALNVLDINTLIDDANQNLFSLNGGNGGIVYEQLISDKEFKEEIYSDTVKILFNKKAKSDTLIFFFTHITKDYFRFLDVRQRFKGIFSGSEPVNFPTNVVGGLGYFTINYPRITLVEKTKIE